MTPAQHDDRNPTGSIDSRGFLPGSRNWRAPEQPAPTPPQPGDTPNSGNAIRNWLSGNGGGNAPQLFGENGLIGPRGVFGNTTIAPSANLRPPGVGVPQQVRDQISGLPVIR